MNLLSILLKVMLADTAISALSGKTGLSSGSLKKLLPLAIPLLLRYMTKNASSQNGALSLLGALTQHTTARSADEMFADADEEDGGKIVQHILGDDSSRAIETLAAESGMSSDDVTRALGGLAPALLTMLSAATNSASAQSSSGAMDLSSLLGMFGGSTAAASTQQSAGSSLLGSLLGMTPTQTAQQSSGGMGLLDALLGVTPTQTTQQSASSGGGLFSSLLGLSPSQPAAQQQSSTGLGLFDALLGGSSAQPQQSSSSGSLLGSLLGISSPQQATQQSVNNLNGNNLLSLLLGAMQ